MPSTDSLKIKSIRQKFFRNIFINRRFLIFILLVLIIGLTLPQGIEGAGETGGVPFWQKLMVGILELPVRMALFTVGIGFFIWAFLTNFIFALAATLGIWVVEIATKIPITGPGSWAQVVGWEFTRGFANMFFILILVVIGLATILRIKEYEVRKALPRLIVIALLINFSPVLVGFVVDVSNLITNSFLDAIKGEEGLFTRSFEMSKGIADHVKSFFFDFIKLTEPTAKMIGHLVVAGTLSVFFLIGAFVFFLIAFLFVARVLAFWVLLILAPLAFIAYILPATRTWWSIWWNQLIQWGLIGVILSFFLYLSHHCIFALSKMEEITGIKDTLEKSMEASGWKDVIQTVFITDAVEIAPYVIGLAFLIIGILVSLTSGAAGATQIINLGIRGGRAAGKWAARVGWQKTKEWASGKVPRQPSIPKEEREAMKARGEWGRRKAIAYWAKRVGTIVTTPVAPYAFEARRVAIARGEKEAEETREESLLLRRVKDPTRSTEEKIGLVAGGIRKGKGFKEILQKNLTEAEKIKYGLAANQLGATEQAERIARGFIQHAERMGFKRYEELKPEEKAEWDAKGYRNITDKLISEAEKDEIKDFAKNFWADPELMEAVQRFWGGPQLGRAADEFGRKFVEDYMRTAEARPKPIPWYLENNPRALLYLTGNPAQDLGFRSIKGLSRAEVRELIEWWRAGRPPRRPFRRRP